MKIEDKIKTYFEHLSPKKLGLTESIKVTSVKKIGIGASNLNYLVVANKKNFNFRLNIDRTRREKTRQEFEALNCISDHNIGPKAYLIDESKKVFDEGFLILEFIEGKTLSSSQYKLNSRIIRNLAKLVAELHNIKPTISLKKDFVNPKDYLREIKEYRSQIKDLGAATIFLELFDETFNKLERKYQNITFPEITSLIHGDIQEQNILITKKGIRLIDFESLSISDPGTEISYIFLEFGKPWSKNQEDLFFNEYLKYRKDKTLRARVDAYRPLRIFIAFLWAILHVLKIKKQKMHEEFTKRERIENHIEFAGKQLKRVLETGILHKKYRKLRVEDILG